MESSSSIRSTEPIVVHSPNHEYGSRTIEHTTAKSTTALGGLRKFIIEKRLASVGKKTDELTVSLNAHKEPADVITNLVADDSRPGSLKHRDPNPTLSPKNLSERRQLSRSSRRQARANTLRSSNQYRLRQIFGEDLGTPEYIERVKGTRMSSRERRKALKAQRKFKSLDTKANHNENKVQRSAEGIDIPGRIINNRLNRVSHKAEKLEKRLDAHSGERTSKVDKVELSHNLHVYFDPIRILKLKRKLKLEADKIEVDAVVSSLSNSEPIDINRDHIEATVLDKLVPKHFGLTSRREVQKTVPKWLEQTVYEMLQQSEKQLENMINSTTAAAEPESAHFPMQAQQTEQPRRRYSFEPIEEDTELIDSTVSNEDVESSESENTVHKENQAFEINELNNALNDMERIKPEDPLYAEISEKLLRSIEKISTETIYSGGTTIQGTDEVVGQTANTHYSYETTDDAGDSRKIPLDTDLAKKLLAFKSDRLKSLENDKEASKSPKQRIADAGSDALDKLRNIIND